MAGATGARQRVDLRVVRAGGPPHVPDAVGRARASADDDEDGLRGGLPLDAPPLPGQRILLVTMLALFVHGPMPFTESAWMFIYVSIYIYTYMLMVCVCIQKRERNYFLLYLLPEVQAVHARSTSAVPPPLQVPEPLQVTLRYNEMEEDPFFLVPEGAQPRFLSVSGRKLGLTRETLLLFDNYGNLVSNASLPAHGFMGRHSWRALLDGRWSTMTLTTCGLVGNAEADACCEVLNVIQTLLYANNTQISAHVKH